MSTLENEDGRYAKTHIDFGVSLRQIGVKREIDF